MQKLKIDNNIHLEKLEHSHAQRVFELTEKNRELFKQWLIWVDGVKSVEDTKAFISSSLEKNSKKKTFICTIFYDNELVGTIELIIQKGYGITKGELGYWLDRDFHGKGILHKSAKKIIEIGFSHYKVDKIVLRCAVRNERSCNVAQKLGFSHEGRQREEIKVNGVLMDVNMFALLKKEWRVDKCNK